VRYFRSWLNQLVAAYHEHATFVFVYIMEAHAVDEWPLFCINDSLQQHTTLEERLAGAQKLTAEFPFDPRIHMVLDDMSDSYNSTYSSWPFRYYVVDEGVVRLKEMPVGDTVSLKELEAWLMRKFGRM
jgi:hypothetical protein